MRDTGTVSVSSTNKQTQKLSESKQSLAPGEGLVVVGVEGGDRWRYGTVLAISHATSEHESAGGCIVYRDESGKDDAIGDGGVQALYTACRNYVSTRFSTMTTDALVRKTASVYVNNGVVCRPC